ESENNPLGRNYDLIKSLVSTLQERTGRTYFKKIKSNPAVQLSKLTPTPISLDIQTDLMFTNPGILRHQGSQRLFTKIIQSLKSRPTRKSATYNLDRVRCCINETFGFEPTDGAIWTSMRSNNIHRLTRNFLWKSTHNTYHVGPFWDRIPNFEIFGTCSTCEAPESLEHILLECDAPGQQQVWRLTEIFWN
ncbi:hypothetical protein B0H11DRAFT_1616740, partial [Mycena galericulata]